MKYNHQEEIGVSIDDLGVNDDYKMNNIDQNSPKEETIQSIEKRFDRNSPDFNEDSFYPYPTNVTTKDEVLNWEYSLETYNSSGNSWFDRLCNYIFSEGSIFTRCISLPTRKEAYALLRLMLPLMIGFIATGGVNVVNLMFLGHLEQHFIASASLGIMFMNVMGHSVIYGMNSAIDMMGSQAFGAQNYMRVGLICQRMVIISFMVYIPIAFACIFSSPILQLLAIEPHIANYAQTYTRIALPGLFGNALLDIARRYMEVQGNVIPCMIASLTALALAVPLDYFFIFYLEWGYIGGAVVYGIAAWASLATVIVYCKITGFHHRTWPTLSKEIFHDHRSIYAISLPSTIMLVCEWWSFEVHIALSSMGERSSIRVATQGLLISINSFLFKIPISLSVAASARIGAFLGANKHHAARHCARIVKIISVVTQLSQGLVMLAFKNPLARAFTDDAEVLYLMQSVLPITIVSMMFDGFAGANSGIMRGTGQQRIAAAINLIGYWLFALPTAYFFAYYVGSHYLYDKSLNEVVKMKGWGVWGQWFAVMCTVITISAMYTAVLLRHNWKEKALMVHLREGKVRALEDAGLLHADNNHLGRDDNCEDDDNESIEMVEHGSKFVDSSETYDQDTEVGIDSIGVADIKVVVSE